MLSSRVAGVRDGRWCAGRLPSSYMFTFGVVFSFLFPQPTRPLSRSPLPAHPSPAGGLGCGRCCCLFSVAAAAGSLLALWLAARHWLRSALFYLFCCRSRRLTGSPYGSPFATGCGRRCFLYPLLPSHNPAHCPAHHPKYKPHPCNSGVG